MCFLYGGGVMLSWRAGSGVGKYNAKTPKQDSKRFNFITKTIHFAHLGILFIYGPQDPQASNISGGNPFNRNPRGP